MIIAWTAAALLCVVYVFSSLTYGRTLGSTETPVGFQSLVAEAFLDGHIDLGAAPPELLALPDPYDPAANTPFRAAGLHDLALYDGKMYSVTGPTPVVLFNVPYRLLGFGYLNANLATLAYCIGGFLAAVALFQEVRRRFAPSLPIWGDVVAVVAIGLGSPVPWLVSIGRSYEAAIACGYLATMTAAFLLVRALRDPARPTRWMLGLGSAVASAGIGARPHLIVLGLFVAAAAWAAFRVRADRRHGQIVLAVVAVPFGIVVALLGLYNYARFGSPGNFGNEYQLAGWNMQLYPGYRASYVVPNLFEYLLSPPRFESEWPFVHLRLNVGVTVPTRRGSEPVAGVLALFPLIPVGLATAAIAGRLLWARARGAVELMGIGLLASMLILFALSLPFNATTMRYTIDFAPLLVVAATIAVAVSYSVLPGKAARLAVAGVWTVTVLASALVGVALVLTRCPGTGSC